MEYLKCAITGREGLRSPWGCHNHHYIKQQQYDKNPQWFIDNGIEQKEMPLWFSVHQDIHSAMSAKRFYDKYGVKKSAYLWNRKEWLNESND